MELVESLIGKKVGSLYITGQKNSKVYCYCSNCGDNNIEYSYSKIMYYIKHNRNITCGCTLKRKLQITKNLIGARYNELVVLQQKDSETVVCRCTCGELLTTNIINLENKSISMCEKCMKDKEKKKEIIMSGRSRKELYYVWIKFKELYNKPTPKFKREIINNNIQFFPSLCDKENGFEIFYQWAIQNKYGMHLGGCYLERRNYLKDFNFDNCFWTSDKSNSYYKFPKLNEEREYQNFNVIYCHNENVEEEYLKHYIEENLEMYNEDYLEVFDEEDCEDIDINSEEFQRYLELFKNVKKNMI